MLLKVLKNDLYGVTLTHPELHKILSLLESEYRRLILEAREPKVREDPIYREILLEEAFEIEEMVKAIEAEEKRFG